MKFTKKEKERMQKAHQYIKNYKPKQRKKDIHVMATKDGKRISIASGYNTVAQAKAYIEKLKRNKDEFRKLGFSNPRVRINPYG